MVLRMSYAICGTDLTAHGDRSSELDYLRHLSTIEEHLQEVRRMRGDPALRLAANPEVPFR